MTTKSVFLSYGRGDDEPFVREMWQYLTDKGIFAWFDRENLPARGESFQKELADAVDDGVKQVDRLTLFLGAHSAKSEWCEREIKHALRNCIPVVIVLVQHTFDGKSAPDGSATTTLPDDIKAKFPANLFDVNGLEFPPNMRQYAGEKLYNLLTNADNLPLAELRNVPPLQIYMDRPEYITAIKKQMRLNDPTDIKDFRTGIVAITSKEATTGLNGIAGIGKTTLASALAQDCNIRRGFQHILWIRVGNDKRRTDAPLLLRAIADQLNPDEDQFKDQYLNEDTARIRVETLLSGKRVLLMLDDVWDKNLLEAFLFISKGYKLVMTTRNRNLMGENMVEIDRLTDEDGVRLMTYYLNPKAPQDVPLIPEFEQIVKILHGHTLAIKVISILLQNHGVGEASAYVDRLRDLTNSNLFDFLEEEENLTEDTQRNRDVELSFSLSYSKLTPDQQKRFRAIGIFAPSATYGIQALQAVWGMDDHLLAKQATIALQNVGLLDYDKDTDRYSQHPLLRAYALKLLTEADENEAVFGLYIDFYIQQAKQIFYDTPVQEWHDNNEGSPNADDIINIKAVGAVLMTQTANGTEGDLRRALEFAYATTQYVNRRMEAKAWAWLQMGLSAVQTLRKADADDQFLLGRELLLLGDLGTIYHGLGQMKKALQYMEQSLPLARDFGDKRNEATMLNNMGSVYKSLGQMSDSLKYYNQALPISHEVGDRRGEATTLTNIGMVYFALGQMDKALKYYEQALLILRVVGDKRGEATTLSSIGLVYSALGQTDKALKYYEQALPISRGVGDRIGEAATLNNIGLVYSALGQTDKALKYYEQALPILRVVGDRSGEATTLNNIGGIYYVLGEMHKALETYEQAFLMSREVGDRGGEATTLNNIGGVYRAWGQLEKTLEFTELALEVFIAIDAHPSVVALQVNIGVLMDEMGRLNEAIELLQIAKKIMIDNEWSYAGGGLRLEQIEQLLISYKRKRGDADVASETTLSPEAQYNALIAKLVEIYQALGEDGLRQMLTENNVPQAQIEEIVAVVIAQVAGEGGNDNDSPDMLPFETIREWVSNTYAVKKDDTANLEAWREQLQGAKSRMMGMGDEWSNEVQFVEALLAVLRDETPNLPNEHPYHEPIQALLEGLKG